MELGEVFLSLPAIVGSSGVVRVLSIPLSQHEEEALRKSADILKRYIATLDQGAATAV
jgi:L-lactate dehydrogenase